MVWAWSLGISSLSACLHMCVEGCTGAFCACRGSRSPENTFKFIRPEPLKEIRVLFVVRYLFEFLQFFVQVLGLGPRAKGHLKALEPQNPETPNFQKSAPETENPRTLSQETAKPSKML